MIGGGTGPADGTNASAQNGTDNPGMATNTTIGAIVTNAKLTKSQLCKLAGMAHDGYARAIRPVHTSMDGDSIYGISVGSVEAPLDIIGSLAADVMEQAIRTACYSADAAFDLPSAKKGK